MTCLATTLLCGTLVIAVPTREGLVVAADTRTSFGNLHCDDEHKIIDTKIARTIAFVTGGVRITDDPNNGNFCEFLKHTHIWIDFRHELKSFIDSNKKTAETLNLVDFGPALGQELLPVPNRLKAPFAGRQTSTVTVATYDLSTHRTWIRHADLYLSMQYMPQIWSESIRKYDLDDLMSPLIAGHTDIESLDILTQFFHSPGETYNFFHWPKAVSQVDRRRAENAAADYICGVIATGNYPTIGGNIDEVFIGKDGTPEHVKSSEPCP